MAVQIHVENPFPELVKDGKKVRALVKDLKLWPPFGTTEASAHKYLDLLETLYANTGSHGNCINTKLFYAFEGELEVVKKFYQGLKVPEELKEALSYNDQLEFAKFLDESGLKFNSIIDSSKDLSKHEDVFGNAYLRYRQATVGDVRKVSTEVVHPKKCMYLFEDKPSTICIAEEFTREGFKKYGYELVRAFPHWTKKRGYRETVFHIKHGSDLYGRPRAMNVIFWILVEWYTSNSMMKISNTDLTAILLFLLKAPPSIIEGEEDEQSQVEKLAGVLRSLMTNEGKQARSMAVLEYEGDEKPTVEKLGINRDYKYNEFSLRTASSYIHASHDVPKEISRMVQTGSGIGSNILKDLYVQFDASVVQPRQVKYENFWQHVFELTFEFMGREFDYGIQFDRNIATMIESLGEGEAVEEPEEEEIEGPAIVVEDE